MSSKDGRGVQIRTEVTNHMLASRQKQSDFVDFFDLSDENNDEAVYPLWTSRENTEEFRRQYYEMHRIATAPKGTTLARRVSRRQCRGCSGARFRKLSVRNLFYTRWRLLRPRAVHRSRTYEKVRITVTAQTTSFDCSRYAETTGFTLISSWVIRDRKCIVRLPASQEGTHLKMVSYLSMSVWKTGTAINPKVQTVALLRGCLGQCSPQIPDNCWTNPEPAQARRLHVGRWI